MPMTMREWGERGLLNWLRHTAEHGRDTALGIGDDCAMVRMPRDRHARLLAASDAMVEGVHFRFDWSTPAEVGWKLAAVNISDIAAMGGVPRWLTVSVALPAATPVTTVKALFGGIRKCCRAYGVELVGGDVTGSRTGVFLDAAITGTIDARRVVRRDGAGDGDMIVLLGECGLSAYALDCLRRGTRLPAALRRRHCAPRPLLREGQWCARSGLVSAMTDLSDSLGEELDNLITAHGKRALVELGALQDGRGPLAKLPERQRLQYQFHGGEDYALLVTVPAKHWPKFRRAYPRRYARPRVVGVAGGGRGGLDLRLDNEPWREAGRH
ncbi:MAG TPA: thiamine-phosphate kinase, partial [bacterium]|nr:thiamine-phosphate kinase [bacterium]